MQRLAVILALVFGVLLIGVALDAVAHAHDGDAATHSHEGEGHNPADHSHLPGEDIAHQLACHGSGSAAGLLLSELSLPSDRIHTVPRPRTDILHGITVPPPDRPPSC